MIIIITAIIIFGISINYIMTESGNAPLAVLTPTKTVNSTAYAFDIPDSWQAQP